MTPLDPEADRLDAQIDTLSKHAKVLGMLTNYSISW